MTDAKEFLKGYYLAKRREQLLQREYDILRESMADIKATDYSKVVVDGTKNPDVIGEVIASIERAEGKLKRALAASHKAKAEVIAVLVQIDDADVHDVLEKRFIQFKPWSQIEDEMFYTERHLHNLKNKGYEEVEKILKGVSDA
jgi:hypothetical protein